MAEVIICFLDDENLSWINYYKEGNEKIKRMNEQIQNQIKNFNVVQTSGKSNISIKLVNNKLKEKSDLCDEYMKTNTTANRK